ncbi:MAG: RNA polymerase sigma factor [Armatimonadota bacterium]|nr:RNA polymerase sigma factor [Armatimonadota bacterium]
MAEGLDRLTDVELMELVKRGDFAAFDELYNRYSGPIRRFLFSLTWDQETSEDYLQEVFLRLWRAREAYCPKGKLSSYIFRIAKNYYLCERRKLKARYPEASLAHEDRNGSRPFENIRANEKIEPEVHLMEEYRRWRLRQAIGELPDGQKMVFVMSHFQEMKYAEISDALGVPVGTVKSRMFAAVNTLRALLKEERE